MSAVLFQPVFSQRPVESLNFESLFNNQEFKSFFNKCVQKAVNELLPAAVEKAMSAFFTKHEFVDHVELALLTSNILPKLQERIQETEIVTGILTDEDLLEDHAPTILEKISELENKIEVLTKVVKPDLLNRDLVNCPKSLTDLRADFLVEHLQTSKLVPQAPSFLADMECVYIDSKEFKYFVEHVLPPEYRPENLKKDYLRKLKKDLFENVESRHKNKGFIDKSFHGNKELRLMTYREIHFDKSVTAVTE